MQQRRYQMAKERSLFIDALRTLISDKLNGKLSSLSLFCFVMLCYVM